ncbi:unnamed protein product [Didymodactylos carnosus]|uniref:NACHT domain-containing protein n=1 Tax=Didymodactylos carnosus TaxID=1234261 RepID=A0A8S2HQS8_9BILA|nr:unnamed protein product [Didymodactylos carnosus]CAF3649820.1 unnamed protein product [Didymodactylos carnosus]
MQAQTPPGLLNIPQLQLFNDNRKRLLVLGRAGIGKTTFCQYIAYQWARGKLFQQFRCILWIRFRFLNATRYPKKPNNEQYTLTDIVEKECFPNKLTDDGLSVLRFILGEVRQAVSTTSSTILLLLDGYDELKICEHLQNLIDPLMKSPYQILTSRPYNTNSLKYDAQMEIIGFRNENIEKYTNNYFTPHEPQKFKQLLTFLKSRSNIYGIGHIPITLELICSAYREENKQDTITHGTTITITSVYSMIIEWLYRTYLEKFDNCDSSHLILKDKSEVVEDCSDILDVIANIAFKAMKKRSLILDKTLIEKELRNVYPKRPSEMLKKLLNIGVVKSLTTHHESTDVEAAKDYYFLHLSFQELFAARYLVNALHDPKGQHYQEAVNFIQCEKRNEAAALRKLGNAATPDVIKGLLALLSDENSDVRRAAAEALRQIGGSAATPDVIKRLLAILDDGNACVRQSAAKGSDELFRAIIEAFADERRSLVLPCMLPDCDVSQPKL